MEKNLQEERERYNEDVVRLQEALQQWQEYATAVTARSLQVDVATQHSDAREQILVEKVTLHQ